jgi:hypothetical protein
MSVDLTMDATVPKEDITEEKDGGILKQIKTAGDEQGN